MKDLLPADLWVALSTDDGVKASDTCVMVAKSRNTGKSMMLEYILQEHGIIAPTINLEVTDDDIASKFQER